MPKPEIISGKLQASLQFCKEKGSMKFDAALNLRGKACLGDERDSQMLIST